MPWIITEYEEGDDVRGGPRDVYQVETEETAKKVILGKFFHEWLSRRPWNTACDHYAMVALRHAKNGDLNQALNYVNAAVQTFPLTWLLQQVSFSFHENGEELTKALFVAEQQGVIP